MSLTATRLEILGRVHDEGVPLTREDVAELIQAARLQVALDELPLPEGWYVQIAGGDTTYQAIANLSISSSYDGAIEGFGPTMLDAVLDLRAELEKR